ncbi:MAG: hypothetical protein AB7E08_04940 [Candidatus Omnitrophota bacterium]
MSTQRGFKLKNDLLIKRLKGEIIILPKGSDAVYILRNNGCEILFDLLSRGTTKRNLIKNFIKYYKLTKAQIEEIESLIDRLKKYGLLTEVDINISEKEKASSKNQKKEFKSPPVIEKISLKKLSEEELVVHTQCPTGYGPTGNDYTLMCGTYHVCEGLGCELCIA